MKLLLRDIICWSVGGGTELTSPSTTPQHSITTKITMEHDEEFDDLTQQILEILCAHLLLLLERQAPYHLPGGKLHQPPKDQHEKTAHLPKTNISQSDFAQLDLQLCVKPSARIETHEALVMWRNKMSTQLNGFEWKPFEDT